MEPLIEHSTNVYRRLAFSAQGAADPALVAGVGHCPQPEATERLADLLLRFIISGDGAAPHPG